jgi:hypothetical protein
VPELIAPVGACASPAGAGTPGTRTPARELGLIEVTLTSRVPLHPAAGTRLPLTWTFANGTGLLVFGMPMFARLISPNGTNQTTVVVPPRSPPRTGSTEGRYQVVIRVPRGGVGKIEIGPATNGKAGLFPITNDPFRHTKVH